MAQAEEEMDMDTAAAIAAAMGDASVANVATYSFHKIKWIYLEKEDVSLPIVTQNENGPCPLLAVINALCLSKRMRLTPGQQSISGQQLIETLFAYILEHQPKDLTPAAQLNYERNVQDAVAVSPQLLTGLNTNVKMSRVDDFEYTPEMIIFDLVTVNLYHGWLIEPGSSAYCDILAPLSYNLLVEKAILGTEELVKDATEEQRQAWEEQVAVGVAAKEFLEQSASQLTVHGLMELHRVLADEQTCVFFRNNHFSTLYKSGGRLYILVTDQGYFDEHQVVFESLDDVDGNSTFYDHNLTEVTAALQSRAASQLVVVDGGGAEASAVTPPATQSQGLASTQEDQDYLLALTLRNEEQTAGGGAPAVVTTGVPPVEVAREPAAISGEPMEECPALIPVALPPSTRLPQAAAPAAQDPVAMAAPVADAARPVLTSDQLSSALASVAGGPLSSQVQQEPVPQRSVEDMDMQLALELQAQMDEEHALQLQQQEETSRRRELQQAQQQQTPQAQGQNQQVEPQQQPQPRQHQNDCIIL